jgi:hypothetical protein
MSTIETTAFIDEVEEQVARVVAGERIFHLPLALLPADVHEGQWLRITVSQVAAPPDSQSELRNRLGRSDPGGPIKL